ncbi:MAG: T9SS type A sorting domain-containing protein, partial [Chitinophagaceae bacterium]|nr:T9SS type A sorting domain-containing protein [Chitinophagaceae bacterium]
DVTATYTRTAGETVLGSPYTISATLAGVLSNYNITYNTAGFTINGVTIDASASSATVPIGQTAKLKAVVTDGTTGVAGVAVKFEIKNSTGTIIQTKNTSSGAGGLIDIAADALTLGVYQVIATAGDGCGTSTAYITMYDANENFVTGGGWINSPAGALTADPSVVGKANFGFVSKYKKGSSQVDGNTEFQFNAGNINFKSTMHESGSLVISGGKATYRGSGTVNGNTGYKFVIVAMDGNWNNGFNPDRFRIKITTTTGQTVYDNQMNSAENADDATILGGGSIVIHETKKKTSNRMDPGTLILAPQEFAVKVFGNPSLSSFRLQLQSSDLFTKFTVKVVDVNGRLMEVKENLYAGQVIELGAAYKQGVYFAEVTQGAGRKVVQLVKAGKE